MLTLLHLFDLPKVFRVDGTSHVGGRRRSEWSINLELVSKTGRKLSNAARGTDHRRYYLRREPYRNRLLFGQDHGRQCLVSFLEAALDLGKDGHSLCVGAAKKLLAGALEEEALFESDLARVDDVNELALVACILLLNLSFDTPEQELYHQVSRR